MMQLGGGGGGTTTTAASAAATAEAPQPPQQSNDSAATEAAAAAAAVGAFEVSEEMSDRGFGGNRWPRQETLALLKIRSDMGIAFRDASVKGPLWDEVSRKMAELGYIRNAKKCKEKFENVYKYHKRTKEGRTGKSEGKTYRFFDQLEALETQSTTSSSLHHQQQQQPVQPQPLQTQLPLRPHTNNNNSSSIFSTPPPVTTIMTPMTNVATLPSSSIPPYTQPVNIPSFPSISGDFLSDNSTSSSSSYSTSSDVEIGAGTTTSRKKRKRKWKEFFERLMKQVVDKQEELQRKFLEAVEKREHERMVREESWRVQEIARINREHEILAQERSMSAAKDAAVMAFLQKLSEKPNSHGQSMAQPQPQQARSQMQVNNNNIQQTTQQQTPQTPQPQPPPLPQPSAQPVTPTLDIAKTDNGDQTMTTPVSASAAGAVSSSRWPKVEIEALIKLRTNLDSKYQENGPKGPLWEEISAGMRRLGFNRNSKRCKEKWENINKYFKKVKESNKKRPEDSKTCPYFHQLDALYRERNKFHTNTNTNNNIASSSSTSGLIKPDNSVPLMVQPEQQWPPATATTTTTTTVAAAAQPDQQHPPPPPQPSDQNFDDEEGTDEEEYDDEEDDEENEEEEEGGEFELVPSNNNKTTNNL